MSQPNFQDQFAAGAALEYLLHLLQRWSKTPWITEHTTGITVACRATLAFFATLGISWKYSVANHELVIGGLSALAIATALWHLLQQYATQHAFGQVIRGGNLDKFRAIVVDVLQSLPAAPVQSDPPAAPKA